MQLEKFECFWTNGYIGVNFWILKYLFQFILDWSLEIKKKNFFSVDLDIAKSKKENSKLVSLTTQLK